jgi:hypothetical protein
VRDADRDGESVLVAGLGEAPRHGQDLVGGWEFLYMNSDGGTNSRKKFYGDHPLFRGALTAEQTPGLGLELAVVGDLDGNGALDLALTTTGNRIWIVYNDPEYTPALITPVVIPFTVPTPSYRQPGDTILGSEDAEVGLAALGDMDQDGLLDLAMGAPQENTVFIGFGIPPPAPRITIPAPPVATIETSATISAFIEDTRSGAEASLSFRRSGDPSFFLVDMVEGADGAFEAAIPAFVTSERGIDYHITATGVTGTTTREPSSGNLSLPVSIPMGFSIPVPSGELENGFRMVSVPAALENASVDSVFVDDLGPYDPVRWRFYSQSAGGVVVEHGVQYSSIEPGRAFWLLGRESGRAFSTGAATTVDTSEPFQLILWPGWNLVANPFNFPIPPSNVTSQYHLDNQQNGPLDVRRYDGSWSDHTGPWMPFEGYAMKNDTGLKDTLYFDPDLSGLPAEVASKQTGQIDWAISISAFKGLARDTDNVALLARSASSGWDRLDKPEPPVIGDYVSVSFVGERYPLSTDARAVAGPWPFTVRTDTPGIVALNFEVPQGISAHIFDRATGASTNARSGYRVASPGDGVPRQLELRVGEAPAEIAPKKVGLDPIFPNPSNGPATLVYRLPEASDIQLFAFDILGRRVSVVVDGSLGPGTHTAIWDASNLPPGIYVLELRADGQRHVRTLTIAQ